MRILITGTAGLLGHATYSLLSKSHTVIPTFHCTEVPNINGLRLDVSRWNDFEKIGKVDVVVHTAALTNVDQCEREPELAYEVNAVGTKNAVNFAKKWNAYLIYISTDYVFDGCKGNYSENDAPNPINVYGKTKLEGEKFVLDYENACVLRCCGNFGWKMKWQKHNFVSWVVEALRNKKEIKIASDLFYSPVLVDFCAEVIAKLIERNEQGIYHCGSRNPVSRLNFVYEICQIFGLESEFVKPTSAKELKFDAKRPENSSLNTEKLGKIIKIPTTKEMLERMRESNGKP